MAEGENIIFSKSFSDFVWKSAAIPEVLWHYTNGAGLLGIAENKSLWCTEYRHLNDSAELVTFTTLLVKSLSEELKGRINTEELTTQVLSCLVIWQTYNVFVCSFCAETD